MTLLNPRAGRILGWAALAALAVLAVFGLWVAPPDRVQSDAQRLMYLHVPSAWIAYLAFGITALASALYLWRRTRSPVWDRLAASSAELGVLFTGFTLVLGSLWGRPVWGVWWAWDARLVTTAVLFFLYVGYLALRQVPTSLEARAKRSAIAALVAFVDVPIVYGSVSWWRSLHQTPTITAGRTYVHGSMAWTLLLGFVAFTLVYAWLVAHRYHLSLLETREESEGLELAIAARRAEAKEVAA